MRIRSRFAVCSLAAAVWGCGEKSSPSTITVEGPAVPAGESGDVIVTLRRSGGTGAVSVPFQTKDDSAVEGGDYVAASGKVEWAEDDMEDKMITISLIDDVVIEPSETMKILLGDPSDGTIDNKNFDVTITDDDHPGDSYAVTSANRLMHFDKAEPGRFSWSVEITGLGSENIVALDVRPADNLIYGLTNGAKLFTIDPMTGVATAKTTLIADPTDTTNPFTGLSGSELGMDFNPVLDRLRITSNTGQNLRVNVDTGEVTTDPNINGLSSGYSAIAHSNNIAAACRTTLYAIDPVTNRFLTQGTTDGTAQGVGGIGFDVAATLGFDVATDEAGKSSGFAILINGGQAGMYTIDLSSGEATLARAAVGPLVAGETVKSFTVSTLDHATPATQQPGDLYGVTATNVISFNRANPEKLCTTKALSGLAANEVIHDLDMRPSTGVLYILTSIGTAGKLHRVDPMSGNLSPAISVSVPLSGQTFGLDFEPTGTVPARIVSNSGQNIRVNDLTTGASTAATALSGAATSAAYTDSIQGAGTATLYVVDTGSDRLSMVSAPNSGTLTDIGPLGVDVTSLAGFDIDGRDNVAYAVVNNGSVSELHTINLATGALSASLGNITGGGLRGMTRATPTTTLFGITTDDKLVRISMTDPSMVTVVTDPMRMPPTDLIVGLTPGEHLMSIDVRPGANVMYALGTQGSIYTLNGSTAGANKAGALVADAADTTSPFSALSGTSFDMDFDPTGTVPLRIVSDAEQNLRVPNLTNNTKVFTDSPLASAGPVNVTAAAYTNSYAGATSTTLYVIDTLSGQLMTQAPNSGQLTVVGALGGGSYSDASVPTLSGFDIAGGNNGIAIAAFQRPTSTPGQVEAFSRLYRIDLATGQATQIGNGIGGAPLRSIAVQIR